jgi:glutathionylspermidine synthase
MKVPLQGWTVSAESWTNTISHVLTTKGDLIVGNIKQSKLFHYVEKSFVTPQLIKRLKGLLNGKA